MGFLARDLGLDEVKISALARLGTVAELVELERNLTERALILRGVVTISPADYEALHDLEKKAIDKASRLLLTDDGPTHHQPAAPLSEEDRSLLRMADQAAEQAYNEEVKARRSHEVAEAVA